MANFFNIKKLYSFTAKKADVSHNFVSTTSLAEKKNTHSGPKFGRSYNLHIAYLLITCHVTNYIIPEFAFIWYMYYKLYLEFA